MKKWIFRTIGFASIFLGVLWLRNIHANQQPTEYDAAAVYISSNSSALSISTNAVIVSISRCLLHGISINTAGSADSKVELFTSSSPSAGLTSSTSAATRIATIAGASSRTLLYDLFLTSGILVNNSGTTPADFTISYLPNR